MNSLPVETTARRPTRQATAGPAMRHAVVLVLVLIVIAVLALVGLGFAELMLVERKGSQNSAQQVQARALVESGVEAARQLLNLQAQVQGQAQGQDASGGWYDNPQRFRGVVVVADDDPRRQGRFTIVAPQIKDGAASGVRFGLENHSGRSNLRTLLAADKAEPNGARNMLLKLPGMTESIADAMLDWIDSDDASREFGAEKDYYSALVPGYAPRNGLPASLDELLLIRGVTPQLLYGADLDHNGRIDSDEPGLQSLDGVDNSDHAMDRGWAAYLTLWSQEQTLRSDGTAKINVNADDLEKLYADLESALNSQWATFIVAYRQNGPAASDDTASADNKSPNDKSSDGKSPDDKSPDDKSPDNKSSGGKSSAATGKLDFSQKGNTTLQSVLDLVGARTKVKFDGQKEAVTLESPLADNRAAMNTNLPMLMDALSTSDEKVVVGRINVNLAPRTVLLCIPGLSRDQVDQIIAQRIVDPAQADLSRRHATWLLSEGIVPLATMKKLLPLVTCGGDVYGAQVFGYFDGGGPSARVEFVLDASQQPPEIVSWRELTSLGRGYLPQTLTNGTNE
jgi:type II secretory pathway component PulK